MVVFLPLLVVVLVFSREESHIFINRFHRDLLDTLMFYWTYLGDGLVLSILIVALLMVSLRHFLTGLAAFATGGLLAQLMKLVFFSDFPRPFKYFALHDTGYQLYLVPGVDQLTWLSFPSGHTSTAFSVFFALSLLSGKKYMEVLLFLLALGVGYSRIYLSQHFLMDVVAGAFIGLLTGGLSWWWLQRYSAQKLDQPLSFRKRK